MPKVDLPSILRSSQKQYPNRRYRTRASSLQPRLDYRGHAAQCSRAYPATEIVLEKDDQREPSCRSTLPVSVAPPCATTPQPVLKERSMGEDATLAETLF